MNHHVTNSLDRWEIEAIDQLEKKCGIDLAGVPGKAVFCSNALNFHQTMNCFFLLRDDARTGAPLVAFAALFAPLETEAEVILCVDPEYRQQGIGRQLMTEVERGLACYGVERLLLVLSPSCLIAHRIIQTKGLLKDHSERTMIRRRASLNRDSLQLIESGPLVIRAGRPEDTASLVELNRLLFDGDVKFFNYLLSESQKEEKYLTYIALLKDRTIGVCHLNLEEPVTLFGFGIEPLFQGKGYGGAFLRAVLQNLDHRGIDTVSLEVSGENLAAISLYTREGFETESEIEYYLWPIPSQTMASHSEIP